MIRRLLILIALLPVWAVAQVTVENVRLQSTDDRARLVFDLTQPVNYRKFHLSKPDRMVIDLRDTSTQLPLSLFSLDDARVKGVRAAERGDGVRIVFDMADDLPARAFTLDPSDGRGYRLVVDINAARGTPAPKAQPEPAVAESALAAPSAPAEIRDIVVVIDPGHGGKDPGAIAINGLYEKDLVLKVAEKLKAEFDALPGFRGELTRSDDRFVPLKQRTVIARQKDADFFVSLHADSFPKDTRVNGGGVFALSLRGATSETARWLAQRENAVDLSHGVELGEVEEDIRRVLLNMSMDSAIRISKQAGQKVLNELGGVAKLHRRQLDQANFVVLRSPDIPSLLIELGFLSSEKDARRLANTAEQKKLAAAIRRGIVTYFEVYPPANTQLYVDRKLGKPRSYVVQKGDTLSRIAASQGVSLSALRRANGLNSDRIRVGQRLNIPTS